MTSERIRVLVVDDSAFARKVVREVLSASPALEVVGIARDGLEALEQIAELQPDVMTLDLVMPNLDGLGTLRALGGMASKPKVVLVSISDEDSELVSEALELGAIDLVRKPTALATTRLYELGTELVRKVQAAASARAVTLEPIPSPLVLEPGPAPEVELAVIGTSTGGPHALTQLIPALPANFPACVAIALHIPSEYTGPLSARLNQVSALTVAEARDGMELRAGLAVLAPGGVHLSIERDGAKLVCRTSREPRTAPYTPSVDVLFTSAAACSGARTLGVVLTGMGDDGLVGSRAIHAAGGRILTESEASSVIYGMPRSVYEAGLSLEGVTLSRMAEAMLRQVYASPR